MCSEQEYKAEEYSAKRELRNDAPTIERYPRSLTQSIADRRPRELSRCAVVPLCRCAPLDPDQIEQHRNGNSGFHQANVRRKVGRLESHIRLEPGQTAGLLGPRSIRSTPAPDGSSSRSLPFFSPQRERRRLNCFAAPLLHSRDFADLSTRGLDQSG